MSFPPPPNDSPPPAAGGGFGPPQVHGPPQGFGPPASPAPGGFGPAPDRFGPAAAHPATLACPSAPPVADGGGNGPRIAAVFVGAVLVAGLAVGALLIVNGENGDATAGARSPATPAAQSPDDKPADRSPTQPGPAEEPAAGGDARGDASGSATPPPAGPVPFVALKPGKCFDHPALDTAVREVVERPCATAHDGEVIGNKSLTGEFASEPEMQAEALRLCESVVARRMGLIPHDGREYYNYALYPSISTYEFRDENRVSCALTLSDRPDGKKLTAPLPD